MVQKVPQKMHRSIYAKELVTQRSSLMCSQFPLTRAHVVPIFTWLATLLPQTLLLQGNLLPIKPKSGFPLVARYSIPSAALHRPILYVTVSAGISDSLWPQDP